MITLAVSLGALGFSILAFAIALSAQSTANTALEEHSATLDALDAADELFEDHEERINELEYRTPAQPVQSVIVGSTVEGVSNG